jgi:hypothetical protein
MSERIGSQMSQERNVEKNKDEGNEGDQQLLSYWRRTFYVGLHWVLLFFTLYTFLFISNYGTLVPLLIVQVLYSFKIKKYKLALLPKKVTNRFYATRFYDRLIRKPKADRGLGILRWIGLVFLFFGLLLLKVALSNAPIVDLDEMTVVRGTFEDYQKLGRKNFCGELILTIRLEDGSLAKFYDSGPPSFQKIGNFYVSGPQSLQNLAKNKEMEMTLWTIPSPFRTGIDCSEYPTIEQVKSKVYQRLYDKNRYESSSRFLYTAGILLSICGSAIMFYLVCHSGKIKTDSSD